VTSRIAHGNRAPVLIKLHPKRLLQNDRLGASRCRQACHNHGWFNAN
jgi:hypothetical protein